MFTIDPTYGWRELAIRISEKDKNAIEEFYSVFREKFRCLILRRLGADGLEDSIHSCVVAVIEKLEAGKLDSPESLQFFTLTIVKRHIAQRIHERATARRREVTVKDIAFFAVSAEPNPEQALLSMAERTTAARVLEGMARRDLYILIRFYFHGNAEAQIRREMGLSSNEFRNLKHRAKKRFLSKLETLRYQSG